MTLRRRITILLRDHAITDIHKDPDQVKVVWGWQDGRTSTSKPSPEPPRPRQIPDRSSSLQRPASLPHHSSSTPHATNHSPRTSQGRWTHSLPPFSLNISPYPYLPLSLSQNRHQPRIMNHPPTQEGEGGTKHQTFTQSEQNTGSAIRAPLCACLLLRLSFLPSANPAPVPAPIQIPLASPSTRPSDKVVLPPLCRSSTNPSMNPDPSNQHHPQHQTRLGEGTKDYTFTQSEQATGKYHH
ncbi:uncharacterized protein [Salvelinus sp. IW2-2015]|uniref:uncharacterized protein n=1 Tax=Salvelinus sp. IW2-2015 TaxID=2691554 RepID=UPI000CDFBB1C|nr:uncharacterized protein LOC111970644 [Salvelinus alpinus]